MICEHSRVLAIQARDSMAEPAPGIDFANLPTPRVLGGTAVLDENPCIVKLSNSWIIMNPGGPPTPRESAPEMMTLTCANDEVGRARTAAFASAAPVSA